MQLLHFGSFGKICLDLIFFAQNILENGYKHCKKTQVKMGKLDMESL